MESTDARVKSELQVLHVGISDADSVHDEHWYGHPTQVSQYLLSVDKYSKQSNGEFTRQLYAQREIHSECRMQIAK